MNRRQNQRPPQQHPSYQQQSVSQQQYTQSQYAQAHRPAPAKKPRRFLIYLCGLLLALFVATIFLLSGQIFAPRAELAQNVNEGVRSVGEAISDEGQAVNGETESSDSPAAQLSGTTLAEMNGGANAVAAGAAEDSGGDSGESSIPVFDDGQSTSPNNGLQPGTRFRIEARVSNDKVENIIFALRNAEVQPNQLILTAAFENKSSSATRFSRIDAVPLEQIRLIDANGAPYAARTADAALLSIQPSNGFAPNGANIGTITFDLPSGPGPFTLSGIHDYPPIDITSDMYLNATVTLPTDEPTGAAFVPDGNYAIYTQVVSSLEALEPLVLHVRTIDLTQDAISLHIGFSNNTLQKFGLMSGPSGSNAWLLDRVNRQYAPHTVSDSLSTLITPAQGIPPGEEHQGVLTFPRPADLSELQFVLEPYAPVTVRFGPTGLNEVQGDASTTAAAQPLPSTSSGVQAYREISELLDRSARSVTTGDQATYLTAFSEAMQPLQAYYFDRLRRLPQTDFQMKLLIPPQLAGIDVTAAGSISTPTLDAQIEYNLRDISGDNPFVYDFSVDFARVDGRWMITNLVPKRNQPFWWGADFSLYETAHFLIFTRPDSVQSLQTLQSEVEIAYATLTSLGIPLEQKYVAYFTGSQDSLFALTGMANTHLVGVALSRYDINGLDATTGVRTINAINRAFYVNSEQFAGNSANGGGAAQNSILRQSIITHELVHLAFSHDARPFTPPWISEGIAVHYSEQFSMDEARSRVLNGQFDQLNLAELTALETLGDHDIVGQQTEMRYIYSGAAIQYLIEQYGEAQVQALFRAYASIPADYIEERMPAEQDSWTTRSVFSAMSVELTDIYVMEYFGLTLPELDQRVKEWLRNGS